jgi:putative ABC transport system permease protein
MLELLRTFVQRLAALFRRRRLEDELDEELRSHLEMAVELNVGKGMSAPDARREALRSFGGVERTKEIYREQRELPMLETAWQDLRFGLRMLWRSPGFSLLIILCLTLGIGANVAVFSWIEGILFRPYPAVVHQEQLFALTGTALGEADLTSWPDLLDLQRSCSLVDSFIVTKIMGTTLSIGDRAEVTTGSIVSANYFDAIGVHPILGRGFETGEDSGRNAHPVTVISYQLWQGRFKGDPKLLGKRRGSMV